MHTGLARVKTPTQVQGTGAIVRKGGEGGAGVRGGGHDLYFVWMWKWLSDRSLIECPHPFSVRVI